jgi:hypothetical protein
MGDRTRPKALICGFRRIFVSQVLHQRNLCPVDIFDRWIDLVRDLGRIPFWELLSLNFQFLAERWRRNAAV